MVGVGLESNVDPTLSVRSMRHGHVHQATVAVQGHSRENHVSGAVALKFPGEMVPGVGRRLNAGYGGSRPLFRHRVPYAPYAPTHQIALRRKIIMAAARALAHVE